MASLTPRQELGKALRELRTLAGLTQTAIGTTREFGQVAVSRVEKGERLPSESQVRHWLAVVNASDEAAENVLVLLRAAHRETRPWSEVGGAGAQLQAVAAAREEDASRVRDCALTWQPGLCQTAEYARLLIPQVDPEGSIDHAAAVAARIERQQILYREGRSFEFLIAESVLTYEPGPGTAAGQRDKLATIATLSDVEMRILPSQRVGPPAWHSFTLYDIGPDVFVSTELLHGGQWVSEVKTLAQYEELWSSLWDGAARGDDAIRLIRGTV